MLVPLPFVSACPPEKGALAARSTQHAWSLPLSQEIQCYFWALLYYVHAGYNNSSGVQCSSSCALRLASGQEAGVRCLPAGAGRGEKLVCRTGHSPTNIFSSPITFYHLCSFLLLQNSYRAVYFPHDAEFIWGISFLVSTLLFWLLLEVERPKCHEKNYSHNISSIAKTKMYLHFGKSLPF